MKRSLLIWLVPLGISIAGCDQLIGHKTLKLTGTLELTEHSVGARVPGRLTTLLVDEGQPVRPGQLIGTLDRFEQATRDYERVSTIVHEGGATQQELEQAQLTMEDQRIIAPVDGVVLLKVREAGEVVAAGGPIVVVGDRSHLWVRVYVPEGVVNRLQLGQPATLRFDGLQRRFKGHVSFIAPTAEFTPRNIQTQEERVTQTFAVKVTLDDVEPFLRPGVAVDVIIHLGKSS